MRAVQAFQLFAAFYDMDGVEVSQHAMAGLTNYVRFPDLMQPSDFLDPERMVQGMLLLMLGTHEECLRLKLFKGPTRAQALMTMLMHFLQTIAIANRDKVPPLLIAAAAAAIPLFYFVA
jgi:hypothetical protein